MKTIRIFISSPGDVSQERERASQVIQSLQRRYSRKFLLAPVFWENLPLEPDMSFQQGIDLFLKNPGVDVAVFILWSRLGSPLGASIRKADGSAYRSGTEREYDLMIQARAQSRAKEGVARPRMVIYTRRDDNSFDARLRGKSTAEKKEMLSQKELVESFMKETFKDAETGENIGAYHPFDRPVTFSQRLRTHLQSILDELAGDMEEVIWDAEIQGPPFLGLDAFQPEHADIFFGREEEILEARNALKEKAANGCAFLLLSGASGSGKSSLARAGILPEILAHETNEDAEVWKSLIVTPAELGLDPILSLLNRLADPSLLPELIDQVPSFKDYAADLATNADRFFQYSFPKAIEAATARLGGSVRFVIVIDQLEELFTKDALSKESRSAFLALVETLARSGHFWVIATARSDFYQDLQSEPSLVRMKEGRGLLDVLPPQPDAITRLIEEPARLAGITFEEKDDQKLSSRILRDAANHAELLPLLEFVLLELFNQADENQLTYAAYYKLGGVEGALRSKAESTYNDLPGEAAETLGQVLQALVTLGDESETGGELDKPVRLRAALTTFPENSPARQLIDAFIAARLFTTAQVDGSNEATFTVAHESLLRVWPKAVAWKNQNSDFLRARTRIAARMKEGSPLLDGDPLLAMSKAFLVARKDGFSASQTIWIEQSIATAEVKTNQAIKRRRLAFSTLFFLTVVAIGSAAWALKNANEAQTSAETANRNLESALVVAESTVDNITTQLTARSGLQDTRRQLLDEVVISYADLLRQSPDSPRVLSGYYRAKTELSLLELDLNPTLRDLAPLQNSFENLANAASKQRENTPLQIYLLNVGYEVFRKGYLHGNTKLQQEVIRIALPLIGQLETLNPSAEEIAPVLANYLNAQAIIAAETDTKKEHAYYQDAMKILKSNHPEITTNGNVLKAYVSPRYNLLRMYLASGRGQESKVIVEEMITTAKKALTTTPDSPEILDSVIIVMMAESEYFLATGQHLAAETSAIESYEIANKLVRSNPGLAKYMQREAEASDCITNSLSESNFKNLLTQRNIYYAIESAECWLSLARLRKTNNKNWNSTLLAFSKISQLQLQIGSQDTEKYLQKSISLLKELALIEDLDCRTWANSASVYRVYAKHLNDLGRREEEYKILVEGLLATCRLGKMKSWQKDISFQDIAWGISNDLYTCAYDLQRLPDVVEHLNVTLSLVADPSNRMSASNVAELKRFYAKSLLASDLQEEAYAAMKDAREFLAEWQAEKESHYYLRVQDIDLHEDYAKFYEKIGNESNEINEIKMCVTGLMQVFGVKINADDEEILKQNNLPNMRLMLKQLRSQQSRKTFTFNTTRLADGKTIALEFYIKDYPIDEKPLSDQLKAIEEIGFKVPSEILITLENLHKNAVAEGINFIDALEFAMNKGTNKLPSAVELSQIINQLRSSEKAGADELLNKRDKILNDLIKKLEEEIKQASINFKGSGGSVAERSREAKLLVSLYLDMAIALQYTNIENSLESLSHAYLALTSFSQLSRNEEIAKRLLRNIDDTRLFVLRNRESSDSLLISSDKSPIQIMGEVPKELPSWLLARFRSGDANNEIIDEIYQRILTEVTERNLDSKIWSLPVSKEVAVAMYGHFSKLYQELNDFLSDNEGKKYQPPIGFFSDKPSPESSKLKDPTAAELEQYGDEEVVVLLMGTNEEGQSIYNYIRVKFRDYFPLRKAIKSNEKIDLLKYGEVIKSGLREPSVETIQEVEGKYKFLSFPK